MIFSWLQTPLKGAMPNVDEMVEWLGVARVCTEWRNIAMTRATLWRTALYVPGRIYGLWVERNAKRAVLALPRHIRSSAILHSWIPITVHTLPQPTRSSTFQHSRCPVPAKSHTANGSRAARRGVRVTPKKDAYAQVVAKPMDGRDSKTLPSRIDFRAMKKLDLETLGSRQSLRCEQVRKLVIAGVAYSSMHQLRSLRDALQAMRALDDLVFESVIATLETKDNKNTNCLADTKIRRVRFVDTTGVSNLLKYLGIPADIEVATEEIIQGDILPKNDTSRGEFVGYDTAEVIVRGGNLWIVIAQGSSTLEARWRYHTGMWGNAAAKLLAPVRAVTILCEGEDISPLYPHLSHVEYLDLMASGPVCFSSALSALQVDEVNEQDTTMLKQLSYLSATVPSSTTSTWRRAKMTFETLLENRSDGGYPIKYSSFHREEFGDLDDWVRN